MSNLGRGAELSPFPPKKQSRVFNLRVSKLERNRQYHISTVRLVNSMNLLRRRQQSKQTNKTYIGVCFVFEVSMKDLRHVDSKLSFYVKFHPCDKVPRAGIVNPRKNDPGEFLFSRFDIYECNTREVN